MSDWRIKLPKDYKKILFHEKEIAFECPPIIDDPYYWHATNGKILRAFWNYKLYNLYFENLTEYNGFLTEC